MSPPLFAFRSSLLVLCFVVLSPEHSRHSSVCHPEQSEAESRDLRSQLAAVITSAARDLLFAFRFSHFAFRSSLFAFRSSLFASRFSHLASRCRPERSACGVEGSAVRSFLPAFRFSLFASAVIPREDFRLWSSSRAQRGICFSSACAVISTEGPARAERPAVSEESKGLRFASQMFTIP